LTEYTACAVSQIDLPVVDWKEIEAWYIKWGVFHYKLIDDEEFREIELDEIVETDTKRPDRIQILTDAEWPEQETLYDSKEEKGETE
jgi:hypothetical protein